MRLAARSIDANWFGIADDAGVLALAVAVDLVRVRAEGALVALALVALVLVALVLVALAAFVSEADRAGLAEGVLAAAALDGVERAGAGVESGAVGVDLAAVGVGV